MVDDTRWAGCGCRQRPPRRRWVVSPQDRRTRRVTQNRSSGLILAGRIVDSGASSRPRGAPATHAALLGWLAMEFRVPPEDPNATPWDIKHLLKVIVMSA